MSDSIVESLAHVMEESIGDALRMVGGVGGHGMEEGGALKKIGSLGSNVCSG
jgi:hypothetical protein